MIDTHAIGSAPWRPPGGLKAGAVIVPLQAVHAEAWVAGQAARVTLTQRYLNIEPRAIEAVYHFPLEPGAAVCAFHARIGDKHIDGEIEALDRAFDRYDDALAEGHGAYLLERRTPGMFSISLGNLPPGVEAEVSLSYVTLLPTQGPTIRLTLPTTIAPGAEPPQGAPGAALAAPGPASGVEPAPGLTIDVHLRLTAPLRTIESPSHPTRLQVHGEVMTVSMSHPEARLDRDFVLCFEPVTSGEPTAQVGCDQDGRPVVMATFQPEPSGLPGDGGMTVFVLDTTRASGHDVGAMARSALLACLEAMTPGDPFTVMAAHGGAPPAPLWGAPLLAGQAALIEVRARLEGLSPAARPTLARAARALLDAPWDAPRHLIFLTAGAASAEEAAELPELARRLGIRDQVLLLGLGAAPGRHTLCTMATASGGVVEFVHPAEALAPAVWRLMDRIGAPVLTDMHITWEGLEVEQAPSAWPPLHPGSSLTVFGRVHHGSRGAVVLESGGRRWRAPVEIGEFSDETLGLLWARDALAEMERRHSRSGGSLQRRNDMRLHAMIDLSRRTGLLCSATSYIAVERRAAHERIYGPGALRQIPSAAPVDGLLAERDATRAAGAVTYAPPAQSAPVEPVAMPQRRPTPLPTRGAPPSTPDLPRPGGPLEGPPRRHQAPQEAPGAPLAAHVALPPEASASPGAPDTGAPPEPRSPATTTGSLPNEVVALLQNIPISGQYFAPETGDAPVEAQRSRAPETGAPSEEDLEARFEEKLLEEVPRKERRARRAAPAAPAPELPRQTDPEPAPIRVTERLASNAAKDGAPPTDGPQRTTVKELVEVAAAGAEPPTLEDDAPAQGELFALGGVPSSSARPAAPVQGVLFDEGGAGAGGGARRAAPPASVPMAPGAPPASSAPPPPASTPAPTGGRPNAAPEKPPQPATPPRLAKGGAGLRREQPPRDMDALSTTLDLAPPDKQEAQDDQGWGALGAEVAEVAEEVAHDEPMAPAPMDSFGAFDDDLDDFDDLGGFGDLGDQLIAGKRTDEMAFDPPSFSPSADDEELEAPLFDAPASEPVTGASWQTSQYGGADAEADEEPSTRAMDSASVPSGASTESRKRRRRDTDREEKLATTPMAPTSQSALTERGGRSAERKKKAPTTEPLTPLGVLEPQKAEEALAPQRVTTPPAPAPRAAPSGLAPSQASPEAAPLQAKRGGGMRMALIVLLVLSILGLLILAALLIASL